jgi:hypothetical protein
MMSTVAAIVLMSSSAIAVDFHGCFTRSYDSRHLAAHPDQLRAADKVSYYPTNFGLEVTLRGRNSSLSTIGSCNRSLHCFVECDGGGIDLKPTVGSVMMYLNRIRMSICKQDPIAEENPSDAIEVNGGLDDRDFLLYSAPENACRTLQKVFDELTTRGNQ